MHDYDFITLEEDCNCPGFDQSDGHTYYNGFIAEFKISQNNLYISISAEMISLPFYEIVKGDEYPSLVSNPDGGSEIKYAQTSHEIDGEINLFDFTTLLKIETGNGFYVNIGPSIGIIHNSNIYQTYNILKPEQIQFLRNQDLIDKYGYKYINDDRTIIVRDHEIPDLNKLSFALVTGINYEIKFNNFIISPGVYFNFPVAKLSSDLDWSVKYIKTGMNIMYEF